MNTSDGRHNKTMNMKGENDSYLCVSLSDALFARYSARSRSELPAGFQVSSVYSSISLIHSSGVITEGLNLQSNSYF